MKKHSREEILLKLGQADELARAGKSQVEICKNSRCQRDDVPPLAKAPHHYQNQRTGAYHCARTANNSGTV